LKPKVAAAIAFRYQDIAALRALVRSRSTSHKSGDEIGQHGFVVEIARIAVTEMARKPTLTVTRSDRVGEIHDGHDEWFVDVIPVTVVGQKVAFVREAVGLVTDNVTAITACFHD